MTTAAGDPSKLGRWTAAMDARLIAIAKAGGSQNDASRALGKTPGSIKSRAHKLKISFHGDVVAGIRAARVRRAAAEPSAGAAVPPPANDEAPQP